MDDLSIMIKIGGRLEKSFGDAIRAAQSGLSGLNAAASREMAAAGRMSAAASREMAAAGKMCTGAYKDMGAAGQMGAAASRRMTSEGKGAAISARDIAAAGRDAVGALRGMASEGIRAASAAGDIISTGKGAATSAKDIAASAKWAAASLKEMAAESRRASAASKDVMSKGKEAASLCTDLAAGGKGAVSLSQGLAKAGEMSAMASKGFAAAGAMAGVAAAGAAAAGRAMLEVGKYSVQVGMDFESAMSDAAATANAGAEDYAKMEQAAMEMGKTTSKTASESAAALKYMSLAGWEVDASITALPSVLKMSEASGMELGRTSDLVTDSMASLGVTVEQLPGYLDVAAKAQIKSNQSAEQLMEAYIGVGGSMKNLGIPITESATALGVLANRGLKGSEAGNALNAVMVNLTTGTGQAGKMMQSLGVSAFDQRGKFIGLEETLQQLNTSLQGCSEEQRNAALAAIGGKQHIDALNALMAGLNTTNEEGISEWAALTNELENCSGSLQAMRDMKLDNLEGDMEALKSASQDAGIKIYKHLNTPLRDFVQFGTQGMYRVSDAMEKDGFSGMAGAAGSAIADGIGMVIEHLPDFLGTAASSIVSFVIGFATELPKSISLGIAKGIPKLLKALPRLGIDIVKAIIRGILSMGSAPIRAVKSLIFGDGDDKNREMDGFDAPKDDTAGLDEHTTLAPGTWETPQAAQVNGAGIEGETVFAAGLTGSMAGQGVDASGIAADATATAESGPAEEELLKAGAERVPAGFAIDTAQPKYKIDTAQADMPSAAGTAFAPQETKELKIDIPADTGTKAQPWGDAFAGSPVKNLQVPNVEIEAQPPGSTEGGMAQSLPNGMDAAGMDKKFSAPPIMQDIALTPPGTALEISAEAPQISYDVQPDMSMEVLQMPVMPDLSVEDVRISPDVMPAVDVEAAQVSAGAVPDMAVENAQIPAGVSQLPMPDAKQIPWAPELTGAPDITQDASYEAMRAADSQDIHGKPIQDITGQKPVDARAPIPSAGIDMTGIGEDIALVKDAVRTGTADIMDGQVIKVSRIDTDDAKKGIGGIFHTLRAGAEITKIHVGRAAQMTQVPLQGVIQAVSGNTLPNAALDFLTEAGNAKSMTKVYPEMGNLPAAITTAGEKTISTEDVSGWGRNISNMYRTVQKSLGMERLPKRSVIDEVLDILSGKRKDQGTPVSGGEPSFSLTQVFNIKGSDEVKREVSEGAQMGVREFDKMMQQWLKQNKRTAFT